MASFGSAAKGTGLKALEFALSICDSVDMYGFTVDPGYKEWTRYFSESRQGHTPLHGRAYYQMMECLGLQKNWMHLHFLRAIGTTLSMRAGIAADAVAALLFRVLPHPGLFSPHQDKLKLNFSK
ncbi:Receptor-like protein kinase 4 [Heracleum sosnowskyi]|uniref:Receptor-like protein kinase 4 n=1 Tax=Heracleum sosnowskyi TaxID=360622 RepID=A0AAD8H8W1_9APIA|nr:Receptor-like protein kinase 4 [Heracleum sosnowskyi]